MHRVGAPAHHATKDEVAQGHLADVPSLLTSTHRLHPVRQTLAQALPRPCRYHTLVDHAHDAHARGKGEVCRGVDADLTRICSAFDATAASLLSWSRTTSWTTPSRGEGSPAGTGNPRYHNCSQSCIPFMHSQPEPCTQFRTEATGRSSCSAPRACWHRSRWCDEAPSNDRARRCIGVGGHGGGQRRHPAGGVHLQRSCSGTSEISSTTCSSWSSSMRCGLPTPQQCMVLSYAGGSCWQEPHLALVHSACGARICSRACLTDNCTRSRDVLLTVDQHLRHADDVPDQPRAAAGPHHGAHRHGAVSELDMFGSACRRHQYLRCMQ